MTSNLKTAISCVALILALTLGPVCLAVEPFTQDKQRPNILFMFTDDQAQNCMGCSGNPHIQTPNMDRLAREGCLFKNAFVTTAICCTSRASILTGQHMRRHGIRDFQTPLSAEAWKQTYPALLRQAGYRTGYLGKFAIGNPGVDRELSLPESEFDFWYGFPQQHSFLQKVDGKDVHLTTELTNRAIEFLRTNPSDEPFCLTIAFKEPHGPWDYFDPEVPNPYEQTELARPATLSNEALQAEPEFIRNSLNGDRSERFLTEGKAFRDYLRTVYRLISRVDIAVGAIREELQRLGLDDNTVIIYSSDHGSMLGAHGLSGKWLMYEESIRVPFIVYDPRLDQGIRARAIDAMALNIDIAPTILALAGIEPPERMQGESLLPVLQGDDSNWRQDWYYEHTYNTNPPRSPIAKTEGVRTERWKYTRYTDTDPVFEQIFDLVEDASEQHNLASQPAFSSILIELRERCDEYRESLQ